MLNLSEPTNTDYLQRNSMKKAKKHIRDMNIRVGGLLTSLGQPPIDPVALVAALTMEPVGTHAKKEDNTLKCLICGYKCTLSEVWVKLC